MNNPQQPANENPLDEFAGQAIQALGAKALDVHETAVKQVEGGQVSMRDSFAQNVKSSALYMDDAAAGIVRTGSLEAKEGAFGVAIAADMKVDQLESVVVAARHLEGREINTALLFAVNVKGDVHSTISPLAGLAIGAGFAAVLLAAGALLRIGQRGTKTNQDL